MPMGPGPMPMVRQAPVVCRDHMAKTPMAVPEMYAMPTARALLLRPGVWQQVIRQRDVEERDEQEAG